MRYEAPDTIDEAVSLLAEAKGNGRILAGGTDLLVQLRAGQIDPEVVIDAKGISEMTSISEEDGGFRIGASVCGAEIGENAALVAAWPGVVEGARLIGSEQIQGRASLGGNLCNASPAADSVPAIAAANAICTILGPDGTREAPAWSIPTAPGETSLATGEVVVSFKLPPRPEHASDAYLRFIPRTEMDIAVVGAAANIVLDGDGTILDAEIILGAVAPTIVRVTDGNDAIQGTKLDDEALEALAAAASAACNPISDKRGTIEYRTRVAGVLAKRAAKIAYDRAGGN